MRRHVFEHCSALVVGLWSVGVAVVLSACFDTAPEAKVMGEWNRTWPGDHEATAERRLTLDVDLTGSHSHRDGGTLAGRLHWGLSQGTYTLALLCDTIDGDPEPCAGIPDLILKCRHDSMADTLTCENKDAPGVEATYTRVPTDG